MKTWRAANELSQKQAVERLEAIGVEANQATWSRIESGEAEPSLLIAVGIARLTAGSAHEIVPADWVSLKKRRSRAA